MKLRGLPVTLVTAVLVVAPAAAHHSFAVPFVADE
jgi:hypothetical protein